MIWWKKWKQFCFCMSTILQLWRHFSQGPQKITCTIKWEKSASRQKWWIGERRGNGFILCMSSVFHLWRQCCQGPQKITCNIKREKRASRQNWWIGGRWGIVFFTVRSLTVCYDVSALYGKWILPAVLSESNEHKTYGKCY